MLIANVGFAANTVIPKVPKYTVIIDKQNGETAIFQVDSCSFINQQQYLNTTPTKNGFVFQDWEGTVSIDEPIKQDSIKITAKWISVAEFQAQQDSILWAEKIQPKVSELVQPIENKAKLLFILVIVLAVLIIGLTVFVFLVIDDKKRFRKRFLYLIDRENGERMNSFISKIVLKATPKTDNQPAKINQEELKNMIDEYLSTKQEAEQKQQEIRAEQQRVFIQNQPQKLFADAIVENHFNRISDNANDDTVFELYLKKATDRTAEFTVYENAKRRVLKNADFIDGCDKQKINSNPVDLQIEKGTAILQDNSKWQISTKAKVKFV
jgi:hypothetical protein